MKKNSYTTLCNMPYKALLAALFIGGILLGCRLPGLAAFQDHSSSARINSLGGASVALADESHSVFTQPAGSANLLSPEASVSYGRLYWGLDDGSQITSPILSFVYPVTDTYGFGFGYKKLSLHNVYDETTIVVTGGKRVHRTLLIGGGLKSMGVKYHQDLYTLNDPVLQAGNAKSGFDMDLGVLYKPVSFLHFAYARQNLLNIDLGLQETATLSSVDRLGVAYEEDMFKAVFETVKSESALKYLLGFEKILLNRIMALRFGFGWGDHGYNKLAAGIGFNLEQCRLDYSVDYPLSGIEETSGTHSITLVFKIFRPQDVFKRLQAEKSIRQVVTAQKAETDNQEQLLPAVKHYNEDQVFPGGFSHVMKPIPASSEKLLEPDFQPVSFLALYGGVHYLSPQKSTINTVKETVSDSEKRNVAFTQQLPGLGIAPPENGDIVSGESRKVKKQSKSKPQDDGALIKSHKVLAGETLETLSLKYYGSTAQWLKIYTANKEKIDKGSLKTGQILIIP